MVQLSTVSNASLGGWRLQLALEYVVHPCVKTKRRLLHWWRDVFPLAFGPVLSVHAALFFEQTPAVHHRNETVEIIARPMIDAEQRVLRVIRQRCIHGRFRP